MTVGRPEGRSADRHGAAIVFDRDLPPRSRRRVEKILSGALYIAKRTLGGQEGVKEFILREAKLRKTPWAKIWLKGLTAYQGGASTD